MPLNMKLLGKVNLTGQTWSYIDEAFIRCFHIYLFCQYSVGDSSRLFRWFEWLFDKEFEERSSSVHQTLQDRRHVKIFY